MIIHARKTYSSCADLPLFNFIKIVVSGDNGFLYSELKTSRNRNIDLVPLSEDIFNEYSSLSGNNQTAHVLTLVKEITALNNKLMIIQEAVNYLSHTYEVRLCDMLRSMGFVFQYNSESMINDLKLTISSAKRMAIQKQEAETELSALTKNDRAVTEKDYSILLVQLSKYMGYKIESKTTTVMEFLNYLEAFNSEHKPTQHG